MIKTLTEFRHKTEEGYIFTMLLVSYILVYSVYVVVTHGEHLSIWGVWTGSWFLMLFLGIYVRPVINRELFDSNVKLTNELFGGNWNIFDYFIMSIRITFMTIFAIVFVANAWHLDWLATLFAGFLITAGVVLARIVGIVGILKSAERGNHESI